MAIRPFPFPFRIGTDICRVERILRIICLPNKTEINRPKLDHFLKRCFTSLERAQFHAFMSLRDSSQVAEHLAGRWAAKEAIIKASSRKIFMSDIVILRDTTSKSSAPMGVILDEGSVDKPNAALDGQGVLLTISHEEDHAVATAVVPN